MAVESSALIENKEQVPFEFNKVAQKYDLATTLSQGYQADLNRSAAAIGLKGNERVLDLCCGTGRSSAACMSFLTEGHLTGIDNSKGMLSVANNKFRDEIADGRMNFQKMDAMHLTVPKASFDAVVAAYGLRNMPDYDAFVQGVRDVLKPGGTFCIHDYSLTSGPLTKLYWAVMGYGFILPFCTLLTGSPKIFQYLIKSVMQFLHPEEIVQLLERNGFEEVQIIRHASWRRPLLHSFVAVKA
jgi:ubiquinone/menaquinone biosynthesis methyltransferase